MIARLGPASGTPTQGGSSTEEGDCEAVRLGRPFGGPLRLIEIQIPLRREGVWRTRELSEARLGLTLWMRTLARERRLRLLGPAIGGPLIQRMDPSGGNAAEAAWASPWRPP